jgi:hypothetical protein
MLVGRRRTTRQGGRRRATAAREREEGRWGGRTAAAGREREDGHHREGDEGAAGDLESCECQTIQRVEASYWGTCSQAKPMLDGIRMRFLFPIL